MSYKCPTWSVAAFFSTLKIFTTNKLISLLWCGAKTPIVLPEIKGLCSSTFLPLKPLYQRSEVTVDRSSCSGLADALLIWLHQWNAKIRPQRDIYLLGLYSSAAPDHITKKSFWKSLLMLDIGSFSFFFYILSPYFLCERVNWLKSPTVTY